MGKTTHAFDIYKAQQVEKEAELKQKVFTLISSGVKALCDKVVGGSASKVLDVKTSMVNDAVNSVLKLNSLASVEVYDNEGLKTLELPVSGTINDHGLITLTFPEAEVLKTRIAEVKVDTSLKSKDQIKARMSNISEFKKKEIENYWASVNKTEVPKTGEVDSTAADRTTGTPYDSATTLTLVKAQYPSSFAVGQAVPIGGVQYKITGENGGEWTLTRTDLVKTEEKKEESLVKHSWVTSIKGEWKWRRFIPEEVTAMSRRDQDTYNRIIINVEAAIYDELVSRFGKIGIKDAADEIDCLKLTDTIMMQIMDPFIEVAIRTVEEWRKDPSKIRLPASSHSADRPEIIKIFKELDLYSVIDQVVAQEATKERSKRYKELPDIEATLSKEEDGTECENGGEWTLTRTDLVKTEEKKEASLNKGAYTLNPEHAGEAFQDEEGNVIEGVRDLGDDNAIIPLTLKGFDVWARVAGWDSAEDALKEAGVSFEEIRGKVVTVIEGRWYVDAYSEWVAREKEASLDKKADDVPGYKECPKCMGSGKEEDGTECGNCGGTGKVPSTNSSLKKESKHKILRLMNVGPIWDEVSPFLEGLYDDWSTEGMDDVFLSIDVANEEKISQKMKEYREKKNAGSKRVAREELPLDTKVSTPDGNGTILDVQRDIDGTPNGYVVLLDKDSEEKSYLMGRVKKISSKRVAQEDLKVGDRVSFTIPYRPEAGTKEGVIVDVKGTYSQAGQQVDKVDVKDDAGEVWEDVPVTQARVKKISSKRVAQEDLKVGDRVHSDIHGKDGVVSELDVRGNDWVWVEFDGAMGHTNVRKDTLKKISSKRVAQLTDEVKQFLDSQPDETTVGEMKEMVVEKFEVTPEEAKEMVRLWAINYHGGSKRVAELEDEGDAQREFESYKSSGMSKEDAIADFIKFYPEWAEKAEAVATEVYGSLRRRAAGTKKDYAFCESCGSKVPLKDMRGDVCRYCAEDSQEVRDSKEIWDEYWNNIKKEERRANLNKKASDERIKLLDEIDVLEEKLEKLEQAREEVHQVVESAREKELKSLIKEKRDELKELRKGSLQVKASEEAPKVEEKPAETPAAPATPVETVVEAPKAASSEVPAPAEVKVEVEQPSASDALPQAEVAVETLSDGSKVVVTKVTDPADGKGVTG